MPRLLTNVPEAVSNWVSYYVDRALYNKEHPDDLPRYPKIVHASALEMAGISMDEFNELVNKELAAIADSSSI